MTAYLEANLLPLILDIKTPKTESYIMIAAGLGDTATAGAFRAGVIEDQVQEWHQHANGYYREYDAQQRGKEIQGYVGLIVPEVLKDPCVLLHQNYIN